MVALYITSVSQNAGKTMLSAGLGKYWLESGKRVGYLKLRAPGSLDQSAERDILFLQKLLKLPETAEILGPAAGNQTGLEAIRQSYATASQDKDIVLIEGLPLDSSSGIIEALDAKILVVHDYSLALSLPLPEYRKLGGRLVGVVFNRVPRSKINQVSAQAPVDLSGAGINLLGIIPEDRVLMALSVADLAEALQGKILNSAEKASDLIENFMMGSSTFDLGPAYYKRKDNKAVIVWGERPGFRKAALASLVLSALQTSTRCVVISHNGSPVPAAAQKAEEKQVPLISAPGSIPELINRLEGFMAHLKFNQEQKLPRLAEILNRSLNLKSLSQDLGLTVS